MFKISQHTPSQAGCNARPQELGFLPHNQTVWDQINNKWKLFSIRLHPFLFVWLYKTLIGNRFKDCYYLCWNIWYSWMIKVFWRTHRFTFWSLDTENVAKIELGRGNIVPWPKLYFRISCASMKRQSQTHDWTQPDSHHVERPINGIHGIFRPASRLANQLLRFTDDQYYSR